MTYGLDNWIQGDPDAWQDDADIPETEDEREEWLRRIEERFGGKVFTSYSPTPLPTRNHDWSATLGEPELDCHVGFGATEDDAIRDLVLWLELDE